MENNLISDSYKIKVRFQNEESHVYNFLTKGTEYYGLPLLNTALVGLYTQASDGHLWPTCLIRDFPNLKKHFEIPLSLYSLSSL